MNRSVILATIAVFALSGCQKGKDQSQTADTTARNLTLAPTESFFFFFFFFFFF